MKKRVQEYSKPSVRAYMECPPPNSIDTIDATVRGLERYERNMTKSSLYFKHLFMKLF